MTSQLSSPLPKIDENVPTPRKNDVIRKRGLIGVINVSTSTVYFTIYTTPEFRELHTASEEIQLMMPNDGWFEQDAMEIMSAIYQCCSEACAALPSKGYKREEVLCVGITNQRETTVVWHAKTGQPLYRAIVWNDIRTVGICDHIYAKLKPKKLQLLSTLSGLRVSPYFSALKIRWLQDNVPEVRRAIKRGECKAGTLDSWIVWNLTKGETHVTDVTNASRTLLMNIKTLNWDEVLLKTFKINAAILPQIRSSSEIFGRITASRSALKEVFICGLIGDQQAALVGQSCVDKAQANCTYDLGCFLLYNTGSRLVYSNSGLLTTVAYKMGPNSRPVYALEGSVAVGGHVFEWLTTKLRILPNLDEAEIFAQSVNSAAGVFFVPAFTGLYAPYWRKDARGLIIGLTRRHNAKHIVRAAHDAICYQMRDILECMRQDCGITVFKLHASGKLCKNKTLMQLQADIAGIPLSVSVRTDRTSLGAAFCAAHAYDFDLSAVAASRNQLGPPFFKEYIPAISFEHREIEYQNWQRAVQRSVGWTEVRPVKGGKSWYFLIIAMLIAIIACGVYYVLMHFEQTYRVFRSNTDLKVEEPLVRRPRYRRRKCPFKL